jgi:ElaA protein
MTMVHWQWCSLSDLSPRRLYALMAVRVEIFVVEQNCPYQELDGLDLEARHLIGWSGDKIAAYLRLLGPNTRFTEPSLGRVLTTQSFRGTGIGKELMEVALREVDARHSTSSFRISAQSHLQRFYGSFGFVTDSEEYLEDGIPHVEMLRPPRDIL